MAEPQSFNVVLALRLGLSMKYSYLLLIALFNLPLVATAQELHTLSNGEVADAEKINDNFQSLIQVLEDQQTLIQQLENRITALEPVSAGEFLTTYDGRVTGAAVVSDDGLTVSSEAYYADGVAYVSQSITEGKHYWETTAQCGPDLAGSQIGIVGSDNESLVSWALIQASENYFGIQTDGARKVNAYDEVSNPPEVFSEGRMATAAGDVFMLAVDMDAFEIYFGKNGIWLGNASPEDNRNPAYSIPIDSYFAVLVSNARQCIPHAMTTNFGASEFSYEVPSGYFKGYCPSNDCEIAQ